MAKSYQKEVELYGLLEKLMQCRNSDAAEFICNLKKSLWEVLHVANTPPRSWQEEFVQQSALSDLANGDTFNDCVGELEKFIYKYPTLAAELNIKEELKKFK